MSFVIKWTEMMWMLREYDDTRFGSPMIGETYLGEAGNSRYWERDQCHAIREGDVVLVIGQKRRFENFIPASAVMKGFPEEFNGKTLAEVMEENVVYNYLLQPVE